MDVNEIVCPCCEHKGLYIENEEMASVLYGVYPFFFKVEDEDYIKKLDVDFEKDYIKNGIGKVLTEEETVDSINELVREDKFNETAIFLKKVIDGKNVYYESGDVIIDVLKCPECGAEIEIRPPEFLRLLE